ncbi:MULTISPECIES: methylenetetrahydrofolate reductase [unclassified Janthinobacterium]|uniref:methylenetetrahydrofolate reductase n=1 Tax=unclassified Janthinobacterium TaxID=2610881 RepID=UPI00161C7D83|nr:MULTISPECIES: methylenetetrahydrofolate reductase [unclassified Janthinobacterium]MBB5609578.1 methylenetetrahydrofolate reductase (NADPH) [Janthinobacterium sp. S3T4]MBB5614750.1 methylenetetrahydrofolate reductase (NADPH) [Janthinobacterium sp. S3M3]
MNACVDYKALPLPASHITHAYSLEVGAKDIAALTAAAPRILPGSTISIPYLPREDNAARLAAVQAVRRLGFEPMPHFSARRIASLAEFETFVSRAAAEAGVERCFVIAGDPSTPMGPFSDSTSLIETGVFERSGIKLIGVGGHPEGHPVMSTEEQWEVLERKCHNIVQRGMTPLIVTQFAFDADIVLTWLTALRQRGINHPVRVGVPGPANIAVLARYAALCGVSACASMWSKYGVSIGKLFGTAGPDLFVDRLATSLTAAHGKVSLHFFPFGGIAQSVKWVEQYRGRD